MKCFVFLFIYLRRKQGKNKKIYEWEERICVHHKKKDKRKALFGSDRTVNIETHIGFLRDKRRGKEKVW